MYRQNYPASANEVIDLGAKYKPAALKAVRQLARSKPFKGTLAERLAKIEACLDALSAAYGINRPRLVCQVDESAPAAEIRVASGSSSYNPMTHTICLRGKLSIVTFLHEFAHALGKDERGACRWSINLFRRCFPKSFGRCQIVGHCLVAAPPTVPPSEPATASTPAPESQAATQPEAAPEAQPARRRTRRARNNRRSNNQ